ncbi:hypothetical protein D3C85_1768420 [compost metagenome]
MVPEFEIHGAGYACGGCGAGGYFSRFTGYRRALPELQRAQRLHELPKGKLRRADIHHGSGQAIRLVHGFARAPDP